MNYHLATMSLIDFPTWLQSQLREREWRPTDLAKRSGMSDAAISRILRGERNADSESLKVIAKALKLPPEQVYRAAGILPQAPDVDEETEKIIYESQDLTNQEKEEVLAFIRMKKNFRKKK